MPQNPFFEKAADCRDHDSYARFINKVKQDAADSEFCGAVDSELTQVHGEVMDQLMAATEQDKILLLVGALKGLRAARIAVYREWPVDEENVSNG